MRFRSVWIAADMRRMNSALENSRLCRRADAKAADDKAASLRLRGQAADRRRAAGVKRAAEELRVGKAPHAGRAAAGAAAEKPMPEEAGQPAAAVMAQALPEAARIRLLPRLEQAADMALLQEARVSPQAARVEPEAEASVEIQGALPREVQAAATAPM